MTLYKYKAIGKEGTLQKGILEVGSPYELKMQLRALGLSLVTYSKESSFIFSRKVKSRLLIDFCLHLEQFEKAGIPLKESLVEIYHAQGTFKLKAVLFEIIKDIEGGMLFSKSLAKHPSVFDPVFIGLIAVGEKTGQFSRILNQLILHLKWIDELQAQVFKAIRYPLIMGSVLFITLLILMVVLVPELITFIKAFSGTLPTSTYFLMIFSEFLCEHIFLIFSVGILTPFLMSIFYHFHPEGQLWKDRLFERFPLIGPLRQKIALARFCHIFAILYECGVDLFEALQTVRKCLRHTQMCRALVNVEILIKEGSSISEAFQRTLFFPPMVVRMVKIGEQTSSLQKTLFHLKEYFDTILDRQINHALGLIEPIMILSLGCVMVLIICSIFLPLYDTLTVLDF